VNFLNVVVHFDGLIGVVTRLQAEQPRNQRSVPGGMRFFLLRSIQTGLGAHPFSCLMGTGSLSLGMKGQGYKTVKSTPSSALSKNAWMWLDLQLILQACHYLDCITLDGRLIDG
jgi:hypothetical protein